MAFRHALLYFCLVGALQGVQLSQLHQQSYWAAAWLVHLRGCSCPNCTNRIVGMLLGWCT